MRAGNLDRHGTLQRFTASADTFGEPVKTWADLATNIHVGYAPDNPSEASEEGQERVAWAYAKFTLRWTATVTPTTQDRFVCMGKTWDILGVTETERMHTWELRCKARSDA